MNSPFLPLELELSALKIAAEAYSNTRYSITNKVDNYSINMLFEGFFTENFQPNNHLYKNISSDFYRNPEVNFSLFYFFESKCLIMSGLWRRCILSLHYEPCSFSWINEDGEEIARPYPDGERFEAIALKLHPIFLHHFS
jgi:hypothetical protein